VPLANAPKKGAENDDENHFLAQARGEGHESVEPWRADGF